MDIRYRQDGDFLIFNINGNIFFREHLGRDPMDIAYEFAESLAGRDYNEPIHIIRE